MKKILSMVSALLCAALLICGCAEGSVENTENTENSAEEAPKEEAHVHKFGLVPTGYDRKNTDYYEGEKPYLNGLEVVLVCECGERLTTDGEIICTDEEYLRDDTEMHITCGDYSCILPINVTPVRRIAFVGDSLTQGASGIAYTVFVKKALKRNVMIGNFGVSGISVTGMGGAWHDYEYCYERQEVFGEVVDFKPELLFVMLGTNDAMGWDDAEATFEEAFASLITAFRRELSETKIIIMTPPPTENGNAFSIPNEAIERGVIPTELAVAEKLGIDVFETNSIIVSRGTDGLYADGVHFSDSGKEYFAGIVTDKICEIYGIER